MVIRPCPFPSARCVAWSLAAPLLLALPTGALAQDATSAGEITSPNPTLEHLSIDWAIDGDDDADGVVTVRFREEGTDAWRKGHPLMRVPADSTDEDYSWPNRQIGSLFGLTPDTSYEIELVLEDPDGGSETRTMTARTRPVPADPAGAEIISVTPDTFDDALDDVQPGDVLVLAAGTYPAFSPPRSGEAAAPIIIRGSDRDSVIIDGRVTLSELKHVWIEDLTVNADVRLDDSDFIVVRRSRINADFGSYNGIFGNRASNGYFADNIITGQTEWELASLGYQGDNAGDGITVGGPGHIIQNNWIQGFRDCVSLVDGGATLNQHSIDIIGNELSNCADDGVEADFGRGNVRVLRNRLTNTFIGLSSQPSLGGPTYFIRNVQYNTILSAFKPLRGSTGNLWYHNTIVKPGDAMRVGTSVEWSRTISRNNIFIGGPDDRSYQVGDNNWNNGEGDVFSMAQVDLETCSFDYDGVGNTGGDIEGYIGSDDFSSFDELVANTTEEHAVEVDLGIFAMTVALPSDPLEVQEPLDFRLASGAAAVDVGLALPNINDGYAGTAPDLGAYELGSALPTYGPRSGMPVCGDSAVEPPEECDDGNTVSGDGCDLLCKLGDGGPSGTGDGSMGGGCGCNSAGGSLGGLTQLALLLFALGLVRSRRRQAA